LGLIGLAVVTFIGYKQTDKHPNTHPDKLNLYIEAKYRSLVTETIWENFKLKKNNNIFNMIE